jgi:hypothetical protein
MDREYFTVKLHSADVDVSTRIRLETRFTEYIEQILQGHEGTLRACIRAAAGVQENGPIVRACEQVTASMRAQGELPSDARFSICLSQVIDL